jgi:peptidyl-dipeptidase Dcp
VDAALGEARGRIKAIAESPEAPTFGNTVAALEVADEGLSRVLSAFLTVAGAASNPERQALERDFAPKLSAYGSEVTSNKALFARIDDLWNRRDELGLAPRRRGCCT